MGNKAVKTPLGMVSSYFFPFASEPVGTHPVYGEKVDMGAAVKGYLSLTTASGDITGDDAMLLYFEQFVSGQVDVETTLSDLEATPKSTATATRRAGKLPRARTAPPTAPTPLLSRS